MDTKEEKIEVYRKKLKNCKRTKLRLKHLLNEKIHNLEEEVKQLKSIIKENEWINID